MRECVPVRLRKLMENTVGIYGCGEPENIWLRLHGVVPRYLDERPLHPSQKIVPDPPHHELTVRVAITPELEGKILRWGSASKSSNPSASARRSCRTRGRLWREDEMVNRPTENGKKVWRRLHLHPTSRHDNPDMSRVCSNCFGDKIARQFIRQNGTKGDCDFCNSRGRNVIWAHELRPLFREVVSLYGRYEPMPGVEYCYGDTLADCISDWEIFNETIGRKTQNAILDAIMGFSRRHGDLSASDEWEDRSDRWSATLVNMRWPWFADHIKRFRRFVIDEDTSGEIIRPERWVPDLIRDSNAVLEVKTSTRLFRGRMGAMESTPGGPSPLPGKDMGAPPPKFARAGRANPQGFSFLYCALEPKTAIVETGRFPGAVVSLREFRARQPLLLADLTARMKSVLEPLATSDLANAARHQALLGSLGRALGEPVHPEDSAVEYVPTQYLAEVIRAAGYDGILFPSALCPTGTNVVIFDPSKVRVTRRGWVCELRSAEYTTHQWPDIPEKRKRRGT